MGEINYNIYLMIWTQHLEFKTILIIVFFKLVYSYSFFFTWQIGVQNFFQERQTRPSFLPIFTSWFVCTSLEDLKYKVLGLPRVQSICSVWPPNVFTKIKSTSTHKLPAGRKQIQISFPTVDHHHSIITMIDCQNVLFIYY